MQHMNTFLVLSAAVAFALPLAAQDSSLHQIANTPPTDLSPNSNLPLQQVGAEDLLALQVYDAPEFSRSVRVSAEGTIRLPMLKNTIRVQGLLPNEIEVLIGEALKREQLFVDPFVVVNVIEYHSRPISVMGAVHTPTILQAVGNVTLLDALARAGGLVQTQAGPEIIVTKPNGDTNTHSIQRIPVKALLAGTDPELNLKLTGGEDIRVPDVGTFVVAGNVTKPGPYPILDGAANNVTTAIAQAGGTIQYYSHVVYLYRPDDKGVAHEIKVELGKIQKRQVPDITLQAKDVLYVPDSSRRRITQEAVTALTSVGQGATTAMIYVLR